MSEIILPDFGRLVTKARVYDLQESVCAARYSHAAPEHCSSAITPKTIRLAQAPAGSGHDCFLKGIRVSFDLRITLKAWAEGERYHFFDIVTSESTMHRIIYATTDQICENDAVDPLAAALLIDKIEKYNEAPSEENFLGVIYNIPSGFMLTARISTNYMQLKTIYAQRKTHRLPEWRSFCEWITTLPHSEMITGEGA